MELANDGYNDIRGRHGEFLSHVREGVRVAACGRAIVYRTKFAPLLNRKSWHWKPCRGLQDVGDLFRIEVGPRAETFRDVAHRLVPHCLVQILSLPLVVAGKLPDDALPDSPCPHGQLVLGKI